MPKEAKKPSNNTDEAKKEAKTRRKADNVQKFANRSSHKLPRKIKKAKKAEAKKTLLQKTKENKDNVNTKAA